MQQPINILSPHFDDAAYGLTVTISNLINKGAVVNLVNCFTITKWTALPVEDKDVIAVSKLRADEDRAYNRLFNDAISLTNLDMLDAPLRNGYIFQSSTFAPNEWQLVDELATYITQNVKGILLCPLAIGNHIDHAICRAAVIKCYKHVPVIFYEDLPYANRIVEDEVFEHVTNLQKEISAELSGHIIKVQEDTLDKNTAISVYQTQLNEEISSEILAHLHTLNGERLWAEDEIFKLLPLP